MRLSYLRNCLIVILLGCAIQLTGCALLVGGAVAGGAAGGVASTKGSQQEHHAPMTYVGTVLANVGYFPAKVLFAGVGAVTSGVTYLATLGRPEPSREIWDSAVGGDYVVTPNMIEGKQPVEFVG